MAEEYQPQNNRQQLVSHLLLLSGVKLPQEFVSVAVEVVSKSDLKPLEVILVMQETVNGTPIDKIPMANKILMEFPDVVIESSP